MKNLLVLLMTVCLPALGWQEFSPAGDPDAALESPGLLDSGWYVDTRRAFVAGHRSLLTTEDGGLTWKALPPASAQAGEPYAVLFVDERRGWLSTSWGLWETVDRGETWSPSAAGGRLPVFADPAHGWMRRDTGLSASLAASFYRTSDAGATWQSCGQAMPMEGNAVPYRVSFISATQGWAIAAEDLHPGSRYEVQQTSDGGCNWQPVWRLPADFDDRLTAIFFSDASLGWLGGEGSIYRTQDGGRHWKELSSIPGVLITSLYFADRNRGWLIAYPFGKDGGLFFTVSGGRSWKRVSKRDALPDAWNAGRLAGMLSKMQR